MVIRHWPGGLSSFLQPMLAACEQHDLDKGTRSPYEMARILADHFEIDVGFADDRQICLLVRSYLTENPPKPRAKGPRRPNGKKDRAERRLSKSTTTPKPKRFAPDPNVRKSFYSSWEWKKVRMQALQRDGHKCGSCGASPKDGIRIVVDHIKPLGKFWELRLSLSNLQVLCDDCNRGKGDWLHADFRSAEELMDDPLMAEFREIMRS